MLAFIGLLVILYLATPFIALAGVLLIAALVDVMVFLDRLLGGKS